MKTFDRINRRTHLYLGLFLLPWLFMYGLSSAIIIHPAWFRADKSREWVALFERDYNRPLRLPTSNSPAELRPLAQEILKDCQLEGAFWVDMPKPDTLHINRFSFWENVNLTYSIKDQKLKAERQQMPLPQAITRMHFRGGYGQPAFRDKFWGFVVDLACVSIIFWVLSGLIMWWRLPRLRPWGALSVAAGALSFALLIWKL